MRRPSEAFSCRMWVEAVYGRITGDWTGFNNAWALTEKSIIPSFADQPTNDFSNASKPATCAPESDKQTDYPAKLEGSVPGGSSESVWETVPQPSCDTFAFGGRNGFLDLFTQDNSYAKQWKYTNAPDADARAVQVAYWALQWATKQGKQSQISASVAKAVKMGDYLRYAMFDKYFKKIGG